MSKIYIGVSHRIDLDSELIKNPLYNHIRCGACYDERSKVDTLGDDTGDNISEKRMSMCELTVQYWMWKNVEADYYGLCHYRRYLSFADEFIDTDEPHGFIMENIINKESTKKYGLLNPSKMKKEISGYDLVTSPYYPASSLNFTPTPTNERELWRYHPMMLIFDEDIDILLEIIKEMYPEYYDTAVELMDMETHRGFNCYIMRKELFFSMCEFQFGVLAEFEKRVDIKSRVGNNERTLGYLGEILYGIFTLWVEKQENYKVAIKQIVYYSDSRKIASHPNKDLKADLKDKIKRFFGRCWLSFRVILRVERRQLAMETQLRNISNQINTLTNITKQVQNKNNIKFWLDEPVFHDDMDAVKKRFWDTYPKATGDLRVIQNANKLLFQCFIYYCKKLGISYWMHGGSLVGTMRHKGFVPWDDDVDIAMLRSDYRKLEALIKDNPYFEIAEFYYTTLGCRVYRFKARNDDLPFFVDIFLYDFYDVKGDEVIDDWRMMTSFKKGLCTQFAISTKEYGIVPNDKRLDAPEEAELKTVLDGLVDSYIDRVASHNSNSKYLLWGMDNNYENHTRYAWHHGRIFAQEDIFPLAEHEFEGMMCTVPANFEKYVFAEYGIEYLEMPNSFGAPVHTRYYSGIKLDCAYSQLAELVEASDAEVSIDLSEVNV